MTLNLKKLIFTFAISIAVSSHGIAQQGTVTVNQSPEIGKLLRLKKDINSEELRFKIQIYSGNRSAAEAAKANFDGGFSQYSSRLEYETPNYKIWVGNFKSRLEAERALIKIKRKFTSAFIFKPSK